MDTKTKYLSFGQKLAYGSGDFGSNAFYSFVASFVMIYLTDTMGMNPGIIGTLMFASKMLDGITDVFFGNLMDNTRTKMGKARPWLLGSSFVLLVLEILLFSIPAGASGTIKYVYFFIVYTAANALAYTANNISYATLTMLITKNPDERVQLGTFRFIFATAAAVVIGAVSVGMVSAFGGGTAGWRMTAIVMSAVQLLCNCLVVFCNKELPEDDGKESVDHPADQENKVSFVTKMKLLIHNKYYFLVLIPYMMMTLSSTLFQTMGIYYCTYVLHNAALLGVLSMTNFAMIIGLIANPILVSKFGMGKVITVSMGAASFFYIVAIPFGYKGMFIPVVVCLVLKWVMNSGFIGSLNAIIAEVAVYQKNKDGVMMEGTMYSCSSVGQKVGGGIATALGGWLLNWGGYDGALAEQSASAINMINIGYFVIPAVVLVIATVLLSKNKVCEENKRYSSQS